ncbi:MAG: tetratricopeptide repeat protein [Actinomycetota bacterium]|nr:tetratricopeptide repeat protein [Actinomycetota bacterium]
MLATSREPLGLGDETLWGIGPLSVPGQQERSTPAELEAYGSVRLFVERALSVERTLYGSSGFALQPENAQTVAEICSRLEGIPLAIELAAAWVGTLSVEQISQRLKDSLRLLKSGSRTVIPRQRTLRGAMDWSYMLLSQPEQTLFGRLAVFAGGWTLEAAEAVSAGDDIEEEEVLELLWGLVNKSLVVAEGVTQSTAARYRMLEPIRQHAWEKLNERGETDERWDRHVAYFLVFAEEAVPELAGPQRGLWVDRLEREHDNLREALSRVLQRGEDELALRFGAALWRFWFNRGYLSEGIGWIERILADGESGALPTRVKVLEGMGWLTQFQGDTGRARATYEEMLTLSRELGDMGNVATALNSLGMVAAQQGDSEQARTLLQENLEIIEELEAEGNPAVTLKRFHVLFLLGYLVINEDGDYARGTSLWDESLTLAKEVGDTERVGWTLANLAHPALLQGDYERARTLSEEALEVADEVGNASVEIAPAALINLGLAAVGLGEYKRAMESFDESLVMCQEMGRTPQVIETLEGMAGVAGALGEATRAAHLWGAAEAAREVAGIALSPSERALHEPHLTSARSKLGEAAWEEALAEGHVMSLEEAAEYALSEESDQPEATLGQTLLAHDESMGDLTPRERELALLVARGLTNRQISTELSISERTAANHVAKILKKLGLRSRAQIATWATERRLLTPDPD